MCNNPCVIGTLEACLSEHTLKSLYIVVSGHDWSLMSYWDYIYHANLKDNMNQNNNFSEA